MNEEYLKKLEILESAYNQATYVCHPIEFQSRQLKLLYSLADCFVQQLQEYRIKQGILEES